ncbi:MAG: beta-propeller domain-containing protein [Enhygromyxa sp.]
MAAWPIGCNSPESRLGFDGEAEGETGGDGEAEGDGDGETGSDGEAEADPGLIHDDSCDELTASLKARIADAMEARLRANLDRAVYGLTYSCEDWGEEEEEEEEEEAGEFSGTNVQVAGVDEADFVKNDGSHLYILADNHFWVLDAWPADMTHVVSTTLVDGTPLRMYVHADTAVIYSSLGLVDQPDFDDPWAAGNNHIGGAECTYGYDCDFTGDGHKLQITVLDISDRANPRRTRDIVFNGSYLNSRRIGMNVHTAAVFPELNISGLFYWPLGVPAKTCGLAEHGLTLPELYAMFEELRLFNLALIEATPVEELLPSITDTHYDESELQVEVSQGPLSACDEVYLSQTDDARGFLSLASLTIGERAPMTGSTIMSRPGAVYGSKDALYVAVRHRRSSQGAWFPGLEVHVNDATSVHKFALRPDQAGSSYAGSGVVKGRILNQFAMDEREGVLRIATTVGWLPSPNVYSTITTLEEQGSQLVEIGRVDHLAPTEDIRSVRFRDEIGFVVTFKKTDPLFVINLADPRNPKVEGELKIPGYSTYMHVMNEDHLLTMGYDAEDLGNFAYFQGLQLQVIDVADLADPTLLHKEVIGTRGSTSDAATNHLAFTYFKARDLLAVPMTICGGGADHHSDVMTFSGLLVYRVTADEGFTLLGGVPHEEPEQMWTGKCSNWWTKSDSKVKRSVFMEDWVFSIAPDLVNVAHLDDLEHPVVSITLTGD